MQKMKRILNNVFFVIVYMVFCFGLLYYMPVSDVVSVYAQF